MKKTLLSLCLLLLGFLVHAAHVDTLLTPSKAMNKQIKAVIITPDDASDKAPLPVVYLLHGYSGNYADWIRQVPTLTQWVDREHFMIVCPDGGF